MGRQWRIEYQGALYHVLSRGNEQSDIFYDDEDRLLFLDTLVEMSECFDIDIAAYVLMGNHYHLLLKTNLANLSKAMQWLGVTYTMRFNTRHSRSGHLFQGRYKSILVQDNAYLARLSLYIHRNPLKAKIVERLTDYKWSSYNYLAYKRKAPEWLSTKIILSQFRNTKDKHRAYRERAQKYSDEESRVLEDLRHGIILGTKNFVSKIRSTYLPDRPDKELPQQKKVARDFDPERLLSIAAKHLDCDIKHFRDVRRISTQEKENRDLIMYALWKTGSLTNEKIGKLFEVTYSSVSHSIRSLSSRLKNEKELRKKADRLYSLFEI